ncbi:MAG TPA: YtxH domain-containing protein [Thermodesulfovibrionales bacterium]|nr:YtxH domain-containing protein [Thermodesulfovibrionales bacterium]
MRCDEEGCGAGSIFLSFVLGGLVGAGVALLLAPKSGQETRQRIRELADDAREKAEDYVVQAKGRVTSAMDKGKNIVEEKKSVISAAVEAGREAYEKEKERLAKEH